MFANPPVYYQSKGYVHSCILNNIFREFMKLEQKQGHVQSEVLEQLGGMRLG